MPQIIAHNSLTGQVGPVVFVAGQAQTDDERMLDYFTSHSAEYDVLPDDEPAPPADPYDDLTDEQVAEAYALNVGGNATSRKGQVKVLRAVEAEYVAKLY